MVRVAVQAPLRTALDYLPPEGIVAAAIPLGARVRVPVGPRSTVGLVVAHSDDTTVASTRLRNVQALLDERSLLDEPLLHLLNWTAQYYHHPLGEVIAAALPRALRDGAPLLPRVQSWRLTPAGRAALDSGAVARAPRQRELLAAVALAPEGMLDSLALAAVGATWRSSVRRLQRRGWLEPWWAVATQAAVPAARGPSTVDTPLTLTASQREAVESIETASGTFAVFVLQGATGSGKTEVYLQCTARTLARDRSVLVLVPEIALTPQLVARFRERFSVNVIVMHSGLSDAGRLAAWRAAQSPEGGPRVVLGTRSAVFAPLPRLGLVVVDEEHDGSYKQQEGGCRYNARDLAIVRARHQALPVLLGSATPALETLQNLRAARYRLVRLPRRADQAEAPSLALIDLRVHAAQAGLSAPALRAIERHLGAGGQVLVFINRRGYAPTLLCTGCGWIAPCRHCDARLTVHQAAQELRCHHCGAIEPLAPRCPRCGRAVKSVGQGTERVEQTLRERFARHSLVRLDRDSAGSPGALESVLRSVLSGEARILVGTQMVTKGHHFADVSLVLVLNADQGLFSTDFRAAERLAQTIVQVAGRAGRASRRGEVLLQTEYPEHPLLRSLLDGGYERFADVALAERQAAGWPPFAHLALLRASSRNPDGAMRFLGMARSCAPRADGVRLLGPVPAAMARRAGRHHAQLLLESTLRPLLHRFIDEWLLRVEPLARTGDVRFALDVDPLDIQ